MRIAPNNRPRGATFVAWVGVLAAFGFGVIATLLSAQTAHYSLAVEEARQREALYAAEAGLARAAAMMRRGESLPADGLGFECGRAMVIVAASPGETGGTALKSVASIQIGEREYLESVRANARGFSDGVELADYEWERRYE